MAQALPGFGIGGKVFREACFNKYLLCEEDTVKIIVQGQEVT